MEKMKFLTRAEVEKIVPHKGKMLLLDRVCSYDSQELSAVAEVDISDSVMFFDEKMGGVPVWLAFEYMAQSVGALSGIYCLSKGEEPRLGFIMSLSNFNASEPVFKSGKTVVIKVRQFMRVDRAVTFEGSASVDGVEIAKATLNTVEVDDPKEVLTLG